MSPRRWLHWLLMAPLLLLRFEKIFAGNVSAIIVFGDSSVDSGNNNYISTIIKSDFRPYGRDFDGGEATGRFSNGRLATDFLSEAFGLRSAVPAYLDPDFGIQDFASGVCFASAGTGYDNLTSEIFSVIPLWKELEYFKEYKAKLESFHGQSEARETLTEALYVISLGTNDFLENYYVLPAGRSTEFTVDQYGDYLSEIAEGFIDEIYGLGARKINLVGVPPMGCLPLERMMKNLESSYNRSCKDEYNKVAMDFNFKLQNLVRKLNMRLPNLELVYSDVYDMFVHVIATPSLYGFEDATSSCCGRGPLEMGFMICNDRNPFTCRDANKYVFWDAIHPTERMNNIIANQLMNTTLSRFK